MPKLIHPLELLAQSNVGFFIPLGTCTPALRILEFLNMVREDLGIMGWVPVDGESLQIDLVERNSHKYVVSNVCMHLDMEFIELSLQRAQGKRPVGEYTICGTAER